MTAPLFSADSYSKTFGREVVLKAASCAATGGRVTALLGRNGSGKSTLLRCALGMVRANNGVTHWCGESMLVPRLHRMAAQGLFFLPHVDLLSRSWTVQGHFDALRSRFGDGVSFPDDDPFDVGGLMERRRSQLSGGERRRVELTLAFARRARCLIADEPFLGVEPKYRRVFADRVRRRAAEGAAVLVTGHEVEQLFDLADDIVWVVAGGTYVLGSPAQARAHPEFRAQYLGSRLGRESAPDVSSR